MRKPRKKPCKVASAEAPIVAELPAACASEPAAVAFIESLRWGTTPGCPRCGDTDVYQMTDRNGGRNKRFLWRCRGCSEQFTVRTGTVFEDSRIPLRVWAYAFWKGCSSKKGVSALQISRETRVSYKSALFLMHRIRFAMTPDGPMMRKLSGVVEADEAYVGGKPRNPSNKQRRAIRKAGNMRRLQMRESTKTPVVGFIQRGGDVRAFVAPNVSAFNVGAALLDHVEPSARLMTDESVLYKRVGKKFAEHQTVRHGISEYARGEAHVNSIESFWARLKRQLHGTHHAVSKKHLHRYVSEAAFKHNTSRLNDGERLQAAIDGANGKRLRYEQPTSA